ncbi:hypothetical protein O181_047263 [Austropuccinia psidii MF-1]|uniref:Uncharacterized protein n=1 Tax=Austropuccinia psidii MF-1 TaxID=1389203 RepID=A0A9Q3HJB8_9BASI|nr:hypothetical protein [Austropuccinia psidii MF-1]
MSPPQPPDSDVSFDKMFNRVFSNNTELNSSLSYQDEPISHSLINSLSTPNQSTEPDECHNHFHYLNSPNIVPPAPISHNHLFSFPPPNNMNTTPSQLDSHHPLIITQGEIPNPSIPKHPPNVTPSRSSKHEYPHFNNDQSFEVPANSIHNSQAQVHPLTPTNEIINEELHFSIVEHNTSPNVPSQIPSNTNT